jgi:CheY-like chemotaxis protein
MAWHAIEILLVEDNPGDIRLAQEMLKDQRLQNSLHVVQDGDEALDFMRKQGRFGNAPTPDMVLLDMNLPKVDGAEVMRAMRQDAMLRDIPVVVLVASNMDCELLRAQDIDIGCYAVKPITLEAVLAAVRSFPELGVSIVRIAPQSS